MDKFLYTIVLFINLFPIFWISTFRSVINILAPSTLLLEALSHLQILQHLATNMYC